MEDIRTYHDGSGARFHRGEEHPFTGVFGAIMLGFGVFWVLDGLYFLLRYGSAFADAVGALQVDAQEAWVCWALASLRVLMGAALCYVGSVAWDGREAALHYSWIGIPVYTWYWGSTFWELDPTFRSTALAPDQLFTYPAGFVAAASVVVLPLLVAVSFFYLWAFRPSQDDPGLVVIAVGAAIVGFGLHSQLSAVSPAVRNTAMVFGLPPLGLPQSGLGVMKLVAFGRDELDCFANMDELKVGLDKLVAAGRSLKFSAYDDRDGGERLVRQLQQSEGVRSDIKCPTGGWYRVHRDKPLWRCSEHGDYVDPSERRVATAEEQVDKERDAGGL